MNNAIYQRIARILTRQLMLPRHTVRPHARLAQLDLNSLERNELYCDIEQVFRLEIDDQEWRRVETMQDLADCVARHLGLRRRTAQLSLQRPASSRRAAVRR